MPDHFSHPEQQFEEGYYYHAPNLAACFERDFRSFRSAKKAKCFNGASQRTPKEIAAFYASEIYDLLQGKVKENQVVLIDPDMPEDIAGYDSVRHIIAGQPRLWFNLVNKILPREDLLGYQPDLFQAFQKSVGEIRREFTYLLQISFDHLKPASEARRHVYTMGSNRGQGNVGKLYALDSHISLQKKVAKIHKGKKDVFFGSEVASKLRQATSSSEYLIDYYLTLSMRDKEGNCRRVDFLRDFARIVTLKDKLGSPNNKDSWSTLYSALYGVLSALQVLHSHDLVYGADIKKGNIFYDPESKIWMLGDYDSVLLKGTVCTNPIGVFELISPEFFNEKPLIDKSDMFTVGCMLWDMLCRSNEEEEILAKMNDRERCVAHKRRISKGFNVGTFASRTIGSIMEGCLNEDPDKRFTPQNVIDILKTNRKI